MSFSDFKTIEDVLKKYPLETRNVQFLPDVPLSPPDWFVAEINFMLTMKADVESEMFYRENFIAPFMRQAWQRHPALKLWVNRKLRYDDDLDGEPDYFVAARPAGPSPDPVGRPLLALAEAKQEDFISGWGQCLADMLACQKLNGDEKMTVYGIVSAGEFWQFGQLEQSRFTKNITAYTVHEPAKLLGALDYIFAQCEQQVNSSKAHKAQS